MKWPANVRLTCTQLNNIAFWWLNPNPHKSGYNMLFWLFWRAPSFKREYTKITFRVILTIFMILQKSNRATEHIGYAFKSLDSQLSNAYPMGCVRLLAFG